MQRLHSGLKPVPINARYCNGQRGDDLIGNDPRRPIKKLIASPMPITLIKTMFQPTIMIIIM